jgi:uncharacterized membrane protein YbhN (UPF0104 family)
MPQAPAPGPAWHRLALRGVFGLALLAALAGILHDQLEDLALLGSLKPLTIAGFLLLPMVSLCVFGHVQARLLRVFGVHLSLSETIGLQAMNRVGNMFAPSGGIVARAAYLKKYHGISLSSITSLMIGTGIIYSFVLGALMMIGLAGVHVTEGGVDGRLLLLGSVVFALTLAVIVFPRRLAQGRSRWTNAFVLAVNGWQELSGHRPLLLWTMTCRIGIFALFAGLCGLYLHDIHCQAGWFTILALAAGVELFSTIPFSPKLLGVDEGVIVLCAALLGLDTGKAFTLGVGIRIARTLALLYFIPFVVYMKRRSGKAAQV